MTAEFVCADCGSDEIREAVMVDYNSRRVIRLMNSRDDDVWCDKCDREVDITEGRFWGVDYNTRRREVK